jgi:hypothetical protein
VVASLGATTWAAGAIPGVETPFQHRIIEHAPLVPTSPDRSVGSPQSDDSTSGGPVAAGLPDTPASRRGNGPKGDKVASVVLPQGIVVPSDTPRGDSGKVPPGQTKAKHATEPQHASHGKGHDKSRGKRAHPGKAKGRAKSHHAKGHRHHH